MLNVPKGINEICATWYNNLQTEAQLKTFSLLSLRSMIEQSQLQQLGQIMLHLNA